MPADGADGDVRPWRLFVALPVPHGPAERIAAATDPYRRRFPEARWVPPTSLHVTLLFLGSVAAPRVERLVETMRAAAQGRAPFEVATGPAGGRVRRDGDGVAWLGIAHGAREIVELAAELAAACGSDMTGRRGRPSRTPHPHVTLARGAHAALRDALRREILGPIRGAWSATALTLVRSHLGPGGSVYEALAEEPLPGGGAEGAAIRGQDRPAPVAGPRGEAADRTAADAPGREPG